MTACVKDWVTARAARTASSGVEPRTAIERTVVSLPALPVTREARSGSEMPSCWAAGPRTWSLVTNSAYVDIRWLTYWLAL
nr:hypothetical protein [Actinomycetospora chiangmaiensis]